MDTTSIVTLIVLVLVVVLVVWRNFIWPSRRLREIQAEPFPARWDLIMARRIPYYRKMPYELQEKLRDLVQVFLADKTFYGCAGQEIDDEVRITIASQACILVLNQGRVPFPELESILVYPSTFVATREVANEHGLVSTDHIALLGESWSQGKVILAWDNVEKGVLNLDDGKNVVLHEFAHQLDHESGATNGAPLLPTGGAYRSWAHVFTEEFAELQEDAEHGRHSLMDKYGAVNPAEFFAVATETFFERPEQMARHHAELFNELRKFYRLDPRDWLRQE